MNYSCNIDFLAIHYYNNIEYNFYKRGIDMNENENRKLAVDFCNVLMEIRNAFHNHQLPFSNIRINSHAFHTLCVLNCFSQQHLTMSELAEKLEVTNQYLSRIINDLENKNYVERVHDKQNRRRVYIKITSQGNQFLEEAGENMIQNVLHTINKITENDKVRLSEAITILNDIFTKNNQ